MRLLYNDRSTINLSASEYRDIYAAIKSPEHFEFRIAYPFHDGHRNTQWKALQVQSRSENPRLGLYSLQVFCDALNGERMYTDFTFVFTGEPNPNAPPRFELLGSCHLWGWDWCTTASKREFKNFLRDHDDAFISVMAGDREYKAKFKRGLPLPAHNPKINYMCRLRIVDAKADVTVCFYKE